jgi:hypothetical protein
MLKKLLLATAMLFPLATPALAYPVCQEIPGAPADAGMSEGGSDWECEEDGNINIDDPDLEPNERATLVGIKAAVDKRREEREAREAKAEEARAKAEEARLAQCTVRFLGLGCPKK